MNDPEFKQSLNGQDGNMSIFIISPHFYELAKGTIRAYGNI